MPGFPSIVVSFTAPHRISSYHSNSEGMLGFSKELLRTRTIQIFKGPKTDTLRLTSAIKKSAAKDPTTAEFYLYDVSGECRKVRLNISAFCGIGGSPVACKITVEEIFSPSRRSPGGTKFVDIQMSYADYSSSLITGPKNFQSRLCDEIDRSF